MSRTRTAVTVSGIVEDVTTGGVTRDGNVRRHVLLVDGRRFTTAPNSASTYDAANLREGDEVTLTLNGRGWVTLLTNDTLEDDHQQERAGIRRVAHRL